MDQCIDFLIHADGIRQESLLCQHRLSGTAAAAATLVLVAGRPFADLQTASACKLFI